jgi:hypothetical protein
LRNESLQYTHELVLCCTLSLFEPGILNNAVGFDRTIKSPKRRRFAASYKRLSIPSLTQFIFNHVLQNYLFRVWKVNLGRLRCVSAVFAPLPCHSLEAGSEANSTDGVKVALRMAVVLVCVGKHIETALSGVPEEERCAGYNGGVCGGKATTEQEGP